MAVLLLALQWRRLYHAKVIISGMLLLLVLTAVFDNLIIYFGIVDYDPYLISGLKVLVAPVEDFAYSVVALLIMPLLWKVFDRD
jgi:lycopene cyclase domain-containing protein